MPGSSPPLSLAVPNGLSTALRWFMILVWGGCAVRGFLERGEVFDGHGDGSGAALGDVIGEFDR